MEQSMLCEIDRLRQMTVGELRDEWFRVCGEPCRSRNRDYLWRRLAWEIQARALGGLSDRAKERLADLAPTTFTRALPPRDFQLPGGDAGPPPARPTTVRDARLPSPGTVIVRRWRGRDLRLLVLQDGYELDGARYGSLTEAARAATGSHWNGRLFWGVTQRNRRK